MLFNGFALRTARKNLETIQSAKGVSRAFVAEMCIRDSNSSEVNAMKQTLWTRNFTRITAATTPVSYTHLDVYKRQMYNTPHCWAIYCCGKVFKYLLNMGGLEEMEKRNIEQAKVLYDFLDSSKLFKGAVVPQDLSLIHICDLHSHLTAPPY